MVCRLAAVWAMRETFAVLGRRPLVLATVAVGASALLAAGCGGGGKSKGPTKASYIAQADAICKKTHAQTSPLISQIKSRATSLVAGGSSSAKQVAATVARLGTLAGANLSRIRALATPSGDRAAIARFLNPLTTVVDSIGKAAAALRKGQGLEAVSLLAEMQPTAQKVASAAHAYGFRQCTQVLSPLG
jgi:hypothetical protein